MKAALLTIAILAAWPGIHPQPQPSPAETTGKAVGITDGDTFDLLLPGDYTIRVRLEGIDAPEKRQPFGQAAKKKLSDLIFGKTLTATGSKKDRNGRLIATVCDGSLDVNQEMVRTGYAWHFKKYSSDAVLDSLEREARAALRGLWTDSYPTPPWEYRKNKKQTKN